MVFNAETTFFSGLLMICLVVFGITAGHFINRKLTVKVFPRILVIPVHVNHFYCISKFHVVPASFIFLLDNAFEVEEKILLYLFNRVHLQHHINHFSLEFQIISSNFLRMSISLNKLDVAVWIYSNIIKWSTYIWCSNLDLCLHKPNNSLHWNNWSWGIFVSFLLFWICFDTSTIFPFVKVWCNSWAEIPLHNSVHHLEWRPNYASHLLK